MPPLRARRDAISNLVAIQRRDVAFSLFDRALSFLAQAGTREGQLHDQLAKELVGSLNLQEVLMLAADEQFDCAFDSAIAALLSFSPTKRAHETTPKGTHPGAPRPEVQRVRRSPPDNRYSSLEPYLKEGDGMASAAALPDSIAIDGMATNKAVPPHPPPPPPPLAPVPPPPDMACDSPQAAARAEGHTRSRVEELEAELEEAHAKQRQLEAALLAAADEVEKTRARVEDVLPMELDEVTPTEDVRPLDPADEPTVESDDLSEEEEAAPQPSAAQQWAQIANHGDKQPASISGVTIISVTDEWVKYGQGRNDRFRNPRVAGGFVINSSELRGVNFTMEALDPPPLQPRSSARRAAVVAAPLPKRYRLANELDAEHRARCW